LHAQELVETRSNIRSYHITALSRKECERTAGKIKAAVTKLHAKRN
jgi:hypothetical protein